MVADGIITQCVLLVFIKPLVGGVMVCTLCTVCICCVGPLVCCFLEELWFLLVFVCTYAHPGVTGM